MKTLPLIIISFLLVAITTTYDVVAQETTDEASSPPLPPLQGTDIVYDGEGDEVKPGVRYYISFMTSDYNMWICRKKFGSSDPKACPRQPLMVTSPKPDEPTQVMFELQNKSETVVRESSKIKIKFYNRKCGQSGYWRVAQGTTPEEGEIVLNGSKSKSDTTFVIYKPEQYYTISFFGKEPESEDEYANCIVGLSRDYPTSKLIVSRYSGNMEVYFYKNMSTLC